MPEKLASRECMLQIIRTRMAFRQSMQRIMRENNADITFEMLQVLSCLWREQGVSQQALADGTVKDKASLTYLIANLEKKGYVCRKEDPQDRRNKLVYLTPEGESFSKWLFPKMADFYRKIDEAFGAEELEHLIAGLERFMNIIEKHEEQF